MDRFPACRLLVRLVQSNPAMEITWNKDIDAALRQASESGKPVLLDFSAAPM